MTDRRDPFVFLADTDDTDRLIGQADALLHKHRSPANAAPDDPPVLTEVIEDEDLPVLTAAIDADAPASVIHTAAVADSIPPNFVEQLIELDALIHRRIDAWLTHELPVVLSAQIDAAKARIRDEIHAHVRSTLLSDISQQISELLDANDPRSR